MNLGLRIPLFREAAEVTATVLLLSVIGTLLVLIGGYLGGRMVFDHGTGVGRLSKKELRAQAEAGGAAVPSEE